MDQVRKALRVFLVYSLLWPISLGDKMVHLVTPSSASTACSTPWTLYRDLSRALFGVQDKTDASDSIGLASTAQPAGLLPVQKKEVEGCGAVPMRTVDAPAQPRRKSRSRPQPVVTPSPLLSRLRLSKN